MEGGRKGGTPALVKKCGGIFLSQAGEGEEERGLVAGWGRQCPLLAQCRASPPAPLPPAPPDPEAVSPRGRATMAGAVSCLPLSGRAGKGSLLDPAVQRGLNGRGHVCRHGMGVARWAGHPGRGSGPVMVILPPPLMTTLGEAVVTFALSRGGGLPQRPGSQHARAPANQGQGRVAGHAHPRPVLPVAIDSVRRTNDTAAARVAGGGGALGIVHRGFPRSGVRRQ